MAWTRHQIITVQIYRRYAKLPDCEYRGLLFDVGGCRSSKDRGLTNYHFDHIMSHLEAKLANRIDELVVPAPAGIKLHYWRTRLPKDGQANSRLMDKLWKLWEELKTYLPESEQTYEYLAGITRKASGYPIKDIWQAKAWQVSLTIDALTDRIHYAAAPAAHHKAVLGSVSSVPSVPTGSLKPAFYAPAAGPAVPARGAGSCMPQMTDVPF